MDVRLLSIRDLTGEMQDRWRTLVGQTLEPNPTFEPEALLSASLHHRAWADLGLLVVSEGDRFVACLSVRSLDTWHRLPVRALTTRLDDGPVPLLPVLGTPLVAADAAAPALRALLSALATGQVDEQVADLPRRPPSMLVLERWNDEGPVARLWRETCQTLGLPFQIMDAWQRPLVRRAPDNAFDWAASFGGRRLAEAERRHRRLAEQVGEVRYVDRSQDPTAVDDYLALEASGWKGRTGTVLRTTPQRAAVFRDMCERWAAGRRLLTLTLEAGGRSIAIRCAVRSGQGLFLLRTSYDEAYSRYGPGILVQLATTEHCFKQTDLEWIDPCCAPSNTHYRDFFPDRLAVATAVTGFGATGRAALAARRLAGPAAKRIRRSARRVFVTTRPVTRSNGPPTPNTAAKSFRGASEL